MFQIYSEGQASQVIKDWNIGTFVDWKGPFGVFSYQPNEYKSMIILACGTGIAPFIQVIKQILDNEDDLTQITLVYSSRTQEDILLKDILDEFSDYWNFTVRYFLTRSSRLSVDNDKSCIKYNDKVFFERVSETSIAKLIVNIDHLSCLCLICGTKSFNKDMINILLHLGVKHKQIFIF